MTIFNVSKNNGLKRLIRRRLDELSRIGFQPNTFCLKRLIRRRLDEHVYALYSDHKIGLKRLIRRRLDEQLAGWESVLAAS